MNTLFLRLEAPLQAWGLRARWEERDTATEPTKSGVVGLLGCALGVHRSSPRLPELTQQLHMGIRVDGEGTRLIDYHTTGGGFYQSVSPRRGAWYHTYPYIGGVLSAIQKDGKIEVKFTEGTNAPETDVSYRHYLTDASFLVALQGDAALIGELAAAVQNPVFPVFLGRKACVPSCPVFAGVGEYATLSEALHDISTNPIERPRSNYDKVPATVRVRFVLEHQPSAQAGTNTSIRRQRDVLRVAQQRVFMWRYVAESSSDFSTATPMIDTLEG